MKHLKKLLVNGDEVTALNKLIAEGPEEDLPDNEVLGRYQVQFDTMFHMHVEAVVTGDAGSISIHLFNGGNERVSQLSLIPGGIDQDFQLEYEGATYRLTIERRAEPELTDQHADRYIETGGVRCPHCGTEEITAGKIQTDAGVAWQRVSCDACGAEWRDNYVLDTVAPISGPTQNTEEA